MQIGTPRPHKRTLVVSGVHVCVRNLTVLANSVGSIGWYVFCKPLRADWSILIRAVLSCRCALGYGVYRIVLSLVWYWCSPLLHLSALSGGTQGAPQGLVLVMTNTYHRLAAGQNFLCFKRLQPLRGLNPNYWFFCRRRKRFIYLFIYFS